MTDTHHGTTTQLVPVTLPGVGDTYLDQSMVPKITVFIANAQARGVSLHFNSAFRTPEHQERLRHDPNAITPATHSLHSAGFAVDVNYSTVSEEQREVIRTAAHDAGLSWGGNFHRRDPPHFYADPPIDRSTAIANATRQYYELTGHHRPRAPEQHNAPTHRQNALQAPPAYPALPHRHRPRHGLTKPHIRIMRCFSKRMPVSENWMPSAGARPISSARTWPAHWLSRRNRRV